MGTCFARAHSSKRCRDDHEASEERNAERRARNLGNAGSKLGCLVEVGAVGNHNAHCQRKREEGLAQRRNYQFGREFAEVRNKVEGKAVDCPRHGKRIHRKNCRHDDKRRHHDEVCLFKAVINAQTHDEIGDDHEDKHEQNAFRAIADEVREIGTAINKSTRFATCICCKVLRYPAADYAVVRHDDERHGRHKNADERKLLAERLEGTDSALPRFTTKSIFQKQQRDADGEYQDQIYKQEHAAAVLGCQIREAPHRSQANSGCRRRKNKRQFARPGGSTSQLSRLG